MLQRCWWKKRAHFTWSWCPTWVLLLSCPKAWFYGSCQQTWLKKHSDLKDSLIFLMVHLIKKLIEYQLSMTFLPADMIFAQTPSDAFEASVYVGSGQGPSLRTHSTHLKPQQGHIWEWKSGLIWSLCFLKAAWKYREVYGFSITKADLKAIDMEMKFQVTITRNISWHKKYPVKCMSFLWASVGKKLS